jgi:membrane associated rhomboid family serine protease
MGLYDRDYTRDEDDSSSGYRSEYIGGGGRSKTSITVILIIINAAVYLADALFSPHHRLMRTLAVDSDTILQPWMWWQFVTAGFAHSPVSIWHILFNMFVLWSFGVVVEQTLGRREFLRFYMVPLILGNIIFSLRAMLFDPGASALGASGAVTAVVILFACLYPKQTLLLFMIIPIPAWLAAILIVGIDVLGAFNPPAAGPRTAHDVHLVGAAFALAYFYFHWNLTSVLSLDWFTNFKAWFARPRLKVHKSSDNADSRRDAEADRVLAKLHSEGEQSLTPRERRTLEDYSRRMRQKLQ